MSCMVDSPGVLPVVDSSLTAHRHMTYVRTLTSVPSSLLPVCRCVDTDCAVTWQTAISVTATLDTPVWTVPWQSRRPRGLSLPRLSSLSLPASHCSLVRLTIFLSTPLRRQHGYEFPKVCVFVRGVTRILHWEGQERTAKKNRGRRLRTGWDSWGQQAGSLGESEGALLAPTAGFEAEHRPPKGFSTIFSTEDDLSVSSLSVYVFFCILFIICIT